MIIHNHSVARQMDFPEDPFEGLAAGQVHFPRDAKSSRLGRHFLASIKITGIYKNVRSPYVRLTGINVHRGGPVRMEIAPWRLNMWRMPFNEREYICRACGLIVREISDKRHRVHACPAVEGNPRPLWYKKYLLEYRNQ